MPSIENARHAVQAFFSAAKSVEAAYKFDTFTFVAIQYMGVFYILQGCLLRNTVPDVQQETFETEMVVAGKFKIADLNISTEEFLNRTLSGIVPTPAGELRFPPSEGLHYKHFHEPFDQNGPWAQQRLDVLRMEGASIGEYVDIRAIDWHLRSAPTPYHGLEDLLFSYSLGPLRTNITIEAIAAIVVLIAPESTVDGTKARIGVRLADGLSENGVRVGYRIISQGKTVKRAALAGQEFDWGRESTYQVGRAEIDVPDAAVVQCFASFEGAGQHFYWITDPSNSQNYRHAAFCVFDPGANVLNEFLSRQGRSHARDLEVGVSWLLWLLGFSVANLGGTAKTQDFVDLVATTPYGHFFVIEYTTGLLKAENKLALLVERAGVLQQSIERSNNRHLKVLPIMVTSKTRQDVRAELEQAERLGVLVITREDLNSLSSRTLVLPDPERLFIEAENAIEEGLRKYVKNT